MATERWAAKDFMGFTPAVEDRRSNQLYAVAGENFLFDSLGPKSVFGEDLLTPIPLGDTQWMQGVRLRLRGGDRVFHFTKEGIVEWSESAGNWIPLWLTNATVATPYRWTVGYLNEWLYFCHPAVGAIRYQPQSGVVERHNPPGFPADPIALCVSNGRLAVVDPVWLSWSAPSDGFNFSPQLGGAGLHKIGDSVSGFPTMVTSYPGGVLTWTTGGVMRSEFTGDQYVWRHRPINTAYRLINSFCSVQIDTNTCVILDERGLFQTKGEAPTPWTPLFNEFFINYARRLKLKIGENVRLEWDELQQVLYVSVSESIHNPIYETTFILYPVLDKWGVFKRPHYGIFPILIDSTQREGDYYGYADGDGQIRMWRDSGYRESLPVDTTLDLISPPIEWPNDLSQAGYTVMSGEGFAPGSVSSVDYSRVAFYPRDGTIPVVGQRLGLEARIVLGLIRFEQLSSSNDEMTEVTQIAIASHKTGQIGMSEDWNVPPSGTADEDWNIMLSQEDWGNDPTNSISYGLRLFGTVDGRTTFTEEVPATVLTQAGITYYACAVTGLWHLLEVTATEPGDRFHLRAFELTAAYAGKLM